MQRISSLLFSRKNNLHVIVYTYVYTYVCKNIDIFMSVYTCICICTCIHKFFTISCLYMRICMYVMHIYIYIDIYIMNWINHYIGRMSNVPNVSEKDQSVESWKIRITGTGWLFMVNFKLEGNEAQERDPIV
jgi:hypothetical protein